MSDIDIRIEGRAGRITLNRPKALNALTYEMCLATDAALNDWRDDPEVALVVIDAEGEKAFCAGGDIVEMYETGRAGDYAYGRGFWRDEYRMNARIADYPKPVVTFLQGFTMGGGVGLGCHASHRVICETSQIAMPECGIGLVPDVGGSLILARLNHQYPGLGSWIGATGLRLSEGRAIMGFADHWVNGASWPEVKRRICTQGSPAIPTEIGPGEALLAELREMAPHFARETPGEILESLRGDPSEPAQTALKALTRNSPIAVACHLEILRRLTPGSTIRDALRLEYRYTYRCMEQGDFIEGIRAAVIDKDKSPKWAHASLADVSASEVAAMLAPLGDDELLFPEDNT